MLYRFLLLITASALTSGFLSNQEPVQNPAKPILASWVVAKARAHFRQPAVTSQPENATSSNLLVDARAIPHDESRPFLRRFGTAPNGPFPEHLNARKRAGRLLINEGDDDESITWEISFELYFGRMFVRDYSDPPHCE
jgi:hypothetical protein